MFVINNRFALQHLVHAQFHSHMEIRIQAHGAKYNYSTNVYVNLLLQKISFVEDKLKGRSKSPGKWPNRNFGLANFWSFVKIAPVLLQANVVHKYDLLPYDLKSIIKFWLTFCKILTLQFTVRMGRRLHRASYRQTILTTRILI